MQYKTLDIKNSGSMEYAALHLYLLDDSPEIPIHTRPMIIVCPGGAYAFTSDREAEMVALQFSAKGYHAAVLRYSVTPAVFPAAAMELGKSIALIREHAQEWGVDKDKIAVCGFSAGGHMVASYCMFWNRDWMAEKLGTATEQLRPDAMILGYPVITSGEYAHHDSIKNLLGAAYEEKREEMSLENQVGEQVPPAFIFHTYEDGLVPVQNSLLLVNALVQKQIPTEFHMFEKGGHGLSIATRQTIDNNGIGDNPAVAVWIDLVLTWLENGMAKQ